LRCFWQSFFRIFVAMKKAIRGIDILMSFIFLLNTLLSGIYLSYFLVSKRDFVTAYCQNQAQPERHCEGACKFAQVTKETSDTPLTEEKAIFLPESFFQEIPILIYSKTFLQKVVHSYFYLCSLSQGVGNTLLRPPQEE